MEYTNGINLIHNPKVIKVSDTTNINTTWTVIEYVDSKISKIYHTPYVNLKPMKIELSNDQKSYWIKDAIVYDYNEQEFTHSSPIYKSMVLYIGRKDRVDKLINIEAIKLCNQEAIEKARKPSKRRAKIVD